jgi:hypothetical protein
MLQPLIRINRAISGILLFPDNPVATIATSEIISVFGPFCTPTIYNKIIAIIAGVLYCPTFANDILKIHYRESKIYNQAEICFILLFILTYGLNNYI